MENGRSQKLKKHKLKEKLNNFPSKFVAFVSVNWGVLLCKAVAKQWRTLKNSPRRFHLRSPSSPSAWLLWRKAGHRFLDTVLHGRELYIIPRGDIAAVVFMTELLTQLSSQLALLIAIENDHRHSEFTHWTWWFSIVMWQFTGGSYEFNFDQLEMFTYWSHPSSSCSDTCATQMLVLFCCCHWYSIYIYVYMIYDIWQMIFDKWYLIYDIWFMIYDIWYIYIYCYYYFIFILLL